MHDVKVGGHWGVGVDITTLGLVEQVGGSDNESPLQYGLLPRNLYV